jgi:hypothetical protein
MAIAGLGNPAVTNGIDTIAAVFNVKQYGALGDDDNNDTTAILTTIAEAETLVVTDSTPGHVTRASAIYFPPGKYKITSDIVVNKSGIQLIGLGSGMSTIVPSHGGTGIKLEGKGSEYLRHVGVAGLSIDYSGHSVNNNAIALNVIQCTDTCFMQDVQVVFPQTNIATGLRGMVFTDSEYWALRDIWLGWLRGTDSIGILFDNDGLNRGNMLFDNVLVRDAYIGTKIVGSNVTNGLIFNNFKVVNTTSGGRNVPKYGIWIAGQVYGATFNDPHIEGEQGGSFNFDTGIFLDSTGTAIRNVKLNNSIIERVTSGIDLGSAGGTVQHCRVNDVRFIGTETITNGIKLGAGATDNWVLGITHQPTVTNMLIDSSIANSGNLFGWNLGGGVSSQPLYYKGAFHLQDGATAPSTKAGTVSIYADVAEGPLKTKSGTGIVKFVCQTAFRTTNVNTTSTSDASIASYTLPAGVLSENNQALRISARGRMAAQPGSFNVKFGATVLATLTVGAGDDWTYEAVLVRVSATTQTVIVNTTAEATGTTVSSFPAETLANAIVVDFRGSVTAGGTLRLDYGAVVLQ